MECVYSTIVLQLLEATYIYSAITASNGDIQEYAKGDNPPGVGSVGGKEKKKYIRWKQGGGRGTEPKGIVEAHGNFILSERHHSGTTCTKTRYVASDEVKKRDQHPYSEGAKKETADEGKYNRFTFSPLYSLHRYTIFFYHFTITRRKCLFTEFHHLSISPCKYMCILCTILLYLFHHSSVKKWKRFFHHFTFSPVLHNFTAKRLKILEAKQ